MVRKTLATIASSVTYLFVFTGVVFADVPINIAPTQGVTSDVQKTGSVVNNAITIVFTLAALLVFVFLILGAFKWITSGGDKEKVKAARESIIHALAGFLILALAALIVAVVGNIVNIDIFNLKSLPSLNK